MKGDDLDQYDPLPHDASAVMFIEVMTVIAILAKRAGGRIEVTGAEWDALGNSRVTRVNAPSSLAFELSDVDPADEHVPGAWYGRRAAGSPR